MQMKIKKINLKVQLLKITNIDENSKINEKQFKNRMINLRDLQKDLRGYQMKKNNINFEIREVFSEVKSMGYDPTIMREILALRKMEIDERIKQITLLKTYKNTLGIY